MTNINFRDAGHRRHFFICGILLTGIFCVFTACSDIEKEVAGTYPDGTPSLIKYYEIQDTGRTLVKEIQYYPNGKKKLEGSYKNNERSGLWTFWFENGNIWSKGTFKNGKSHGEFNVYQEDGSLFYHARYKKGSPHGKWTFYDNKGEKSMEVIYEEGEMVSKENFSAD